MKRNPTAFCFSDKRIRRTIDFLNGVGLDAVRILQAQPAVLNYSVDAKLQPIVDFVTGDMGRGRDIAKFF